MIVRYLALSLILVLVCLGTSSAVSVRDVVFTTKDAGTVTFSHQDHTRQKRMAGNCRTCHGKLYDLKNKKSYSMAQMEKGKSCGSCHNGKGAFPLSKCARCHTAGEIVFRVAATGPTRFSHASHLEQSEDCRGCHPALFAAGSKRRYTMAEMEKGRSCGACHNASQAFSIKECAKCHPVRDVLFDEKTTGNVLFSHAFHTGIQTCSDCHPALYRTKRSTVKISMQQMEAGKSCGACHNGKSAFSVAEKCDSCHAM